MTEETILDTGPLVAFLESDEEHHHWGVARFKEPRGSAALHRFSLPITGKLLKTVCMGTNGLTQTIPAGLRIPFCIN